MSHEQTVYDTGAYDSGARSHMKMIERITGYAPPTCPWRAMYSPLAQEVLAAMPFEEHGNLSVALGADPPHRLVQAIGVFKTALRATMTENERLRIEAMKRDRGIE